MIQLILKVNQASKNKKINRKENVKCQKNKCLKQSLSLY